MHALIARYISQHQIDIQSSINHQTLLSNHDKKSVHRTAATNRDIVNVVIIVIVVVVGAYIDPADDVEIVGVL